LAQRKPPNTGSDRLWFMRLSQATSRQYFSTLSFFDSVCRMNAKHTKTLQAIFAKPTSTSLEWVRIEALFIALGCRVIEGRGSRVRFEFNGIVAAFHRPHPAK